MSRTLRLLFAVGFLSLAVPASAADYNRPPDYRPFSGYTLIHAGTLLPVPGEAPADRQTVIVREGHVIAIEDGWIEQWSGDAEAPVRVVDLSDKFVMPGFIDLHVHLLSQSGGDRKGEFVERSDSYFALQGSQFARWTLEAGFTTVRDLGARGQAIFALRDGVRDGLVPGPRILAAGQAITPSGGHGDIHGYRTEILQALPALGTCDGSDDCRRAVRQMVKRGADVIKVTATGGVLSETATGTGQQFTQEELNAIAETAHLLGRKVTAHAHAKEGIEAALRAGFDSIEHSMWADEGTMELFLETGAWMVPTVYPITAVGDTPEKMKAGPFGNLPPPVMEKLLQLGRQPKDMVALAHSMGVKVALGTDSAVSPHGENANEFIEYVNAGMTPMQALMSGTVHAAEATGIADQTGDLQPGKAADLVGLAANPLEDISAVLDVRFVMRDGIVFKHLENQE